VPLGVLTGDQSAALFATGEPRADTAYVNFGTGAFVQRTLGDAAADAPRLLKSVVLADASRTTAVLEGTVNGAGSALQWAVDALELEDVSDVETLLAREIDPPLFLNGVSGLGAPYWIADFEPRFVGDGSRESKLVAVLESVVFLVNVIFDEMERTLGKPARIEVSGGLSQVSGLCQRLADVSGVAVERTADPEGTARGLAWLVHRAPAFIAKSGHRFTPRENARLHDRFARFRAELETAIRPALR
jgi:glycerol kinase